MSAEEMAEALKQAQRIVTADSGPYGSCWAPEAVIVSRALIACQESVTIHTIGALNYCPSLGCHDPLPGTGPDCEWKFCPNCGRALTWK